MDVEQEQRWAELRGEQAYVRLNFAPPHGQARPGAVEYRLEKLTDQIDAQLVDVEGFQAAVLSLGDQRDGASAKLDSLFSEFSLSIVRVGQDRFDASVAVNGHATTDYEFRGKFDVNSVAVRDFAAGLEQLLIGEGQ